MFRVFASHGGVTGTVGHHRGDGGQMFDTLGGERGLDKFVRPNQRIIWLHDPDQFLDFNSDIGGSTKSDWHG